MKHWIRNLVKFFSSWQHIWLQIQEAAKHVSTGLKPSPRPHATENPRTPQGDLVITRIQSFQDGLDNVVCYN